MKQVTSIRQSQHLAPQQLLVARMVQATNDEMEQIITAETEKNLALEVDYSMTESNERDEDYDPELNQSSSESNDVSEEYAEEESTRDEVRDSFFDDDEEYDNSQNQSADDPAFSPIAIASSNGTSRQELKDQISEMELEEEESFVACYLVDILDDSGYLTRDFQAISDDLAFTQMRDVEPAEIERILVEVVQSLDPAGIGARNLRECLLLQLLEKKGSPAALLAYRIIDGYCDEFIKHRYEFIEDKLGISRQAFVDAQRVIRHLTPKPGNLGDDTGFSDTKTGHISPDFVIRNEEGALFAAVLDGNLPKTRISPDYQLMLQRIEQQKLCSEEDRTGMQMVKRSISDADAFISAIRQRHHTLKQVIRALADIQRDYFLSGGSPEALKPMGLQDVADRTGFDISTISRVSNSKFIDTDFGIIPVKSLFTTSITNDKGEQVSNTAVQSLLRQLIEEEDKHNPLSDEALAAILAEKGYPIKRRTVAKYRDELGFSKAAQRRQL